MNNNQVKADLEQTKESIAEILDNLELKYGLRGKISVWYLNSNERHIDISMELKNE